MQVQPTNSATSASSTSASSTSLASAASTATANSSTVDYNSFLQLLVTELKNQDPTTPTDPTQFMSQLASFSSVEQAVQTNTKLGSLLTTNALLQAEGAIGRTATSTDGSVSGQVVAVNIASDGGATALLASGKTLALGNGVTIS